MNEISNAGVALTDAAKRRFGGGTLAAAFVLALVPFALVLAATAGHWAEEVDDSGWYILMSQGHPELVPKPFSNRVLMPALARAMVRFGRLSTEKAFLLEALVSLYLFLAMAVFLLSDVVRSRVIVVLLLFAPFAVVQFESAYLPDLAHAALIAVILALLAREKWGWALVVVFISQVTRESTTLFAIILALVAASQSRKSLAAGAIAASAAGMAAVAFITRHYPPNIYSISTGTYLFLKLPFNVLKNIFGVVLWTDMLKSTRPGGPLWALNLPQALQRGSIHHIGIDTFTWAYPLETFFCLLSVFGIAPAVLAATFTRANLRRSPLWLQVAAIYGTVSFVVSPGLGAGVGRLVYYGWPIVVVAAYFLSNATSDKKLIFQLLAIHVALIWAGYRVLNFQPDRVIAVGMLIALPIQICIYRLVRARPLAAESVPAPAAD